MHSRRSFLHASGAAALAFTYVARSKLSWADPDPSPSANAAIGIAAEPNIYSFSVGALEAHVIQDGVLSLPNIQPMFVPEAKPQEVALLMKQFYLPTTLSISINVLLIKSNDGVVLIDTGAGTAFGAAGGRLAKGLEKLSITPASVKKIIVTHAHGDHIGGLVAADGSSFFPQAEILIAKQEADFWLQSSPNVSKMRAPDENKVQVVAGAKKYLGSVHSQLRPVAYGKITPEISLLAAAGHTPGHANVLLSSGSEKLLHIADSVHVYPLQFIHPEWTMAYDIDPAQAAANRSKLFQSAAKEGTRILGYHMPFPGVGHIRPSGHAFEWLPQPWNV